MTKVNKRYKDRLFRLAFGTKKKLLELYNAVNNSHYTDPDELEITTMDDAVYMGMKNDTAFLLDDILNLYEHQSTFNPNMPVRGLFYLADLYRKFIEAKKLNTYGSKLIKLPVPRYIIFYNGQTEEPDRLELKLSDAFQGSAREDACLELKALLLNINLGHNKELMERCCTLREYAVFVSKVRQYLSQGRVLGEAVDCAAEECIHNGILSELLSTHRAEVRDLIWTEYNEQEHLAMERKAAREEGWEEGWVEGKEEGKEEGKNLTLINLIRKMTTKSISIEETADMLEADTTFVKRIYDIVNAHPDWDNHRIYKEM